MPCDEQRHDAGPCRLVPSGVQTQAGGSSYDVVGHRLMSRQWCLAVGVRRSNSPTRGALDTALGHHGLYIAGPRRARVTRGRGRSCSQESCIDCLDKVPTCANNMRVTTGPRVVREMFPGPAGEARAATGRVCRGLQVVRCTCCGTSCRSVLPVWKEEAINAYRDC